MIKRNLLLGSAMFSVLAAFAGTDMSVYHDEEVSVRVTNIGSKVKFQGTNIILGEETIQNVDSIILSHYVSVNFDGDKVEVSNPFSGVDVKVDGTSVEINSTYENREIKYRFSGKSSNGNVIFSSVYKSGFEFNNLDLTSEGVNPPIYVLTKKNTEVKLVGENSLKNSVNDTVEATMRGKGQFEFKGDGSLAIKSVKGHGIQSGDYVEVKNGKISIDAASDGIHVNDYYLQSGGEVNIAMKADGIDIGEGYFKIEGGSLTITSSADESRGIRCTATPDADAGKAFFNGGNVDIHLSGVASRGVKIDSTCVVDGGDVLVVMSGATGMSDGDYTYTCGVKTDDDIIVEDGNLVVICQSSAFNSRCLASDKGVRLNGGITVLAQYSIDIDEKGGAKKPNAIKAGSVVSVKNVSNLYIGADEDDTNPLNVGGLTVNGVNISSDDEDSYFPGISSLPAVFWNSYKEYAK